MNAHDDYAAALAAYALDALEPQEAREMEAHTASCPSCQAELARLRQVTGALASTVEPEAPPASLRQRTLERATAQPQAANAVADLSPSRAPLRAVPTQTTTPVAARERKPTAHVMTPVVRRRTSWQGLALAASIVLMFGLGGYAWMLRGETSSLRAQLASAYERADALRTQLMNVRGEAARLTRTVSIVNASDLIQVDLAGQPAAAAANGRVLISRGNGLVFRARGLPAPQPGRVYQLWLIPATPGGGAGTPVGAGILTADASGAYVLEGGIPANVPNVRIVAVTEEPGPSGSPGPTTPLLLAGQTAG